MRHQPSAVPIRVLVSDDTRVHTELLADALKTRRLPASNHFAFRL